MNRARRRAARLAVFLECAGVMPFGEGPTYREICDRLQQQYLGLQPDVRHRARVEGRRRIRGLGAEAAALRLIPVPAPLCGVPKSNPELHQKRRARYLEKVRRWPPETPPCPRCRIARGMPKRSWPSRELAEEVCLRQNDPDLHVYPCPVQTGFWHLGHRRKSDGLPLAANQLNQGSSVSNPNTFEVTGEKA